MAISYSLPGAVAATGLSRSSLMRAINAGDLHAKKSSKDDNGEPAGVYIIKAAELERYIDGLVDA